MAHQGFDLQLTRYDERGWRATFYTTGMEHSPTCATGTGWERTPWHATLWLSGTTCRLTAAAFASGSASCSLLRLKFSAELLLGFKPVTDIMTMLAAARDVDFKGTIGNLDVGRLPFH